jgi:DNA-binding SARP family transcriptional activator
MSSQLIRIVWTALEQGEIDPATAIREIQAGLPGGVAALVPFTRHPVPAVRLEAIDAAAACGHPGAIAALDQLTRPENPVVATGAVEVRERREPLALTFTLLGCFSLTRGNWRADDAAWERRVAQRVVRFLLVHRDHGVSEDEILETFWPDRHLDSARRSLHVAISRARRVLDTPGSPTVIHVADRIYRLLLREGDFVDADRFDAAARAALAQHGAARLRLLERGASMWGGEPLPEERYADWALGWRERLTDLHSAVLAALADECLKRGDLTAAGLWARDLIELDPLDEGAHRRLMLAYARAGRPSSALRQFRDCRRALVEQLGVEPGAETKAVQQRILAGETL